MFCAKKTDGPERASELAREFDTCRRAFTALGDENRQQIVIALLQNPDGLRVGEITRCTNLSRPAVSHHLKVLKDAGVVNVQREGTMNFYHMDAGESLWGKLALLVRHIDDRVRQITESRAATITGQRQPR